MNCRNLILSILTLAVLCNYSTFGQIVTEVYATGLTNPIGLTIDGSGNLWVCEQGTGSDDSRVSIVTTNGAVYPFLINLPSEIVQGDPIGAEHVQFDIDGKLLIVQGEGIDSLSESILIVDTSGFTPGNPPLTRNDIEAIYNIGDFSINHGGETTNPFSIVIGPNDDWFISDAGFNGVIKRERSSGDLSVFTQIASSVTTGIVYTGTNFFLGSLTGFPFPTGGAKIYSVDLSGSSSVYQDQLTTIIGVQIDPLDNKLVALQYGEFGAGFQSNTGALYKINNSNVDTLIYGLNFPAGMVFNSSGELFISSFADGEIIRVTGIPLGIHTDNDNTPLKYNLIQNYPNPFNPSTKISWQSPVSGWQTIKVYDVLGNEVSTLVDEYKPAGRYEVEFQSTVGSLQLASGVYFYKLQVYPAASGAGSFVETKKMILLR